MQRQQWGLQRRSLNNSQQEQQQSQAWVVVNVWLETMHGSQ
jgi:hypothetical protein